MIFVFCQLTPVHSMYCVCDYMNLYVSVEFPKYFVIHFVAQYPLERVCILRMCVYQYTHPVFAISR